MFAHSYILFMAYKLLILTFLVGLLITTALVLLASLFNSKNKNTEKIAAYECGFHPFRVSRTPVDINFYLVGIIFLIFDMEVIFIYPWFGVMYVVGYGALTGLYIFLFLLIGGFIYEYYSGVLNWNKI